ncbi:MAG: hypothetical protein CL513_06975 [Actinobacteria bacterium]|nr:hypothetical protein [Actinomycetota bacterium]
MVEGPVVYVGEKSGLHYRHPRPEWSTEMEHIELSSFPTSNPEDLYNKEELEVLSCDFPQGGFVGFDGDSAVAMGLGVQVHFDEDNPVHTVHDIMPGDGSSGHTPSGEWYYGTSIAVNPTYRRKGIGGELYLLRKQVCISSNLKGIIAGGVMPGFAKYKEEMTADEYITAVREKIIYDSTLSFQANNGFELVCALPDYIANPEIDNYAALIIWRNLEYKES